LANDLEKTKMKLDEYEEITVHEFEFEEALKMVESQTIRVGHAALSLLVASQFTKRNIL